MMSTLMPRPTKFQETVKRLCKLLNDYTPGDALPTIRQLAEYMDVSVFTLHCALEELRKNDLIYQEKNHRGYRLKKIPEESTIAHSPTHKRRIKISYCTYSYHNLRKMQYLQIWRNFRNLYEKNHPEIDINEISITATSRREREDQLLLSLLEGNATGIQTSSCVLDSYREMKLLRPLVFPELQEYYQKFSPEIRKLVCRGKNHYMLPLGHSICYIIYNKEHFKTCELNPETTFTNSTTFIAGLKKLKQHYAEQTPFIIYEELDFIQLLQFQLCLDNPKNRPHQQSAVPEWGNVAKLNQSCSWLFELLGNKELLDLLPYNFTPAAVLDLLNERTSMTIGTGQIAAILLAQNQADKFGIAPLPGGTDKIRTLGNVSGILVGAQADDDTAKAYIDYAMSFQKYYDEVSARQGMGSLPYPHMNSSSAKLPEDWKQAYAFLNAGILWESRDSNHIKNLLSDAVAFIRREPFCQSSAVSCQMLADFFNFESENFLSESAEDQLQNNNSQ